MDYTVHGILQARILAWVAFPFSRGSSQPKDRTQISRIAGGFFTSWATTEARSELYIYQSPTILNVVVETSQVIRQSYGHGKLFILPVLFSINCTKG